MRGWKGNGESTTHTVYGPHPWSEFELGVDALYGLGMSGDNGMNRSNPQGAFNNTRFNGDLGPLQPFNNIPAPSPGRVPVRPSSLPTAGGQSTSPNPILDLLGNTLG